MIPLSGEYYVECNEVFRQSTNQGELMLAEMSAYAQGRSNLSLLSVGSGAGLFEMPLLRLLGDSVNQFVGVDVNEHACQVLQAKLKKEYGPSLEFEIENRSFQDFRTEHHFELVLFNHTFEYLDGDRLSWIQKSLDLLSDSGNVLIFSPDRSGINKFYDDVFAPCFSDDLHRLLTHTKFEHRTAQIDARCDISMLAGEVDEPDLIRLLSFLTQADCRELPASARRNLIDYYLSLSQESLIPHPATLFIL